MENRNYLTLAEAGKLFPRPLFEESVLYRIKTGVDGVKLAATFDGKSFWVRPESVDEFLRELTENQEARTKSLSEEIRTRQKRHERAMLRMFGKFDEK